MAELLVHSISVLSKNRQQSYALIFACYATLKWGGGGVTKYFDVSSEEKRVNDQDFDTDCRSPVIRMSWLFKLILKIGDSDL